MKGGHFQKHHANIFLHEEEWALGKIPPHALCSIKHSMVGLPPCPGGLYFGNATLPHYPTLYLLRFFLLLDQPMLLNNWIAYLGMAISL
jgi:hypothetical protein